MDIQTIMRDNAIHDKKIELAASKKAKEAQLFQEQVDSIYRTVNERNEIERSYTQFVQDVKDGIVTEALVCLVSNCVDSVIISEDYNKKLTRQLVTNFVKEEGSIKLLNKFKRTSYLLSELAYVCESTINTILEKADDKDATSHKIDNKDKDQFYKKLNKVDADEAVGEIRNRVKLATEEFIDNNAERKMEIEKILTDTKKKVETAKGQKKSEAVQESYINMGKREADDVRNNAILSVYESMVYAVSKAAVKNEVATRVFVENSSLNMDRITEHCEVLYTFVTALDALKIINVNEEYVLNMLNDLRK